MNFVAFLTVIYEISKKIVDSLAKVIAQFFCRSGLYHLNCLTIAVLHP